MGPLPQRPQMGQIPTPQRGGGGGFALGNDGSGLQNLVKGISTLAQGAQAVKQKKKDDAQQTFDKYMMLIENGLQSQVNMEEFAKAAKILGWGKILDLEGKNPPQAQGPAQQPQTPQQGAPPPAPQQGQGSGFLSGLKGLGKGISRGMNFTSGPVDTNSTGVATLMQLGERRREMSEAQRRAQLAQLESVELSRDQQKMVKQAQELVSNGDFRGAAQLAGLKGDMSLVAQVAYDMEPEDAAEFARHAIVGTAQLEVDRERIQVMNKQLDQQQKIAASEKAMGLVQAFGGKLSYDDAYQAMILAYSGDAEAYEKFYKSRIMVNETLKERELALHAKELGIREKGMNQDQAYKMQALQLNRDRLNFEKSATAQKFHQMGLELQSKTEQWLVEQFGEQADQFLQIFKSADDQQTKNDALMAFVGALEGKNKIAPGLADKLKLRIDNPGVPYFGPDIVSVFMEHPELKDTTTGDAYEEFKKVAGEIYDGPLGPEHSKQSAERATKYTSEHPELYLPW